MQKAEEQAAPEVKAKKAVKKKKDDFELPEIPDYERPELEKYEESAFEASKREKVRIVLLPLISIIKCQSICIFLRDFI